MKRPLPLAEVPESAFKQQVLDLARVYHWRWYFTYRSKRSPAGWPDLQLARDRLILVELKREGGKLSAAQASWIHDLIAAKAETYIVRPRDLEALGRVLAHRGDPRLADASAPAYGAARGLREATLGEIGRMAA